MLCDILEINEELKNYRLICNKRSFGSPHIRQKDRIYERRQNNRSNLSIEEHMEYYLSQGIDKKEAMKKTAKDRGVQKREIYNYLEKLKSDRLLHFFCSSCSISSRLNPSITRTHSPFGRFSS